MNGSAKYADVYVGYPIDGSFTYEIPPDMKISPGIRVEVNFGNRNVVAFVHNVHEKNPQISVIKPIAKLIDDKPIFDARLVDLCRYMAANYLCAVGEAMAMAMPSGASADHRYKSPYKREQRDVRLSQAQEKIFSDIVCGTEKSHLIFGITGSGKTELYIELAKYVMAKGRSVIYLVPEITLSSQIFERLNNVFGDSLVMYHSHLTQNQKLDNWKRFYSGAAKIAVGTRSAVFMQCPDLGMIIVDEEHDGSYKEHSTPRYHARKLAFRRCAQENAYLIMGSATPSIESLYAAEIGALKLHILDSRYGNASLPQIEIIKIDPKTSDMISPKLLMMSKKAIDNGNQIIYLLNRRGFSPFVICGKCGEALQCPYCNISLNYHSKGDLLCHYCGYSRKMPETCAHCSSDELVKLGAGTQRIEEAVLNTFKGLKVFRLDQDSARKKNAVVDLVDKMKKNEIDVLLGTQMVAKGFDFLNVALVGILLADIGLHLPDFRASERIFSLLMQAAGRAGRGDVPGKVIVQALDDGHYLFGFLKKHDYMGFYRYELNVRKMLEYPPFARLARLLVRGKNETKVIDAVNSLKNSLDDYIKTNNADIRVMGPSPAPFAKISNNYRYHIILKSKDGERIRDAVAKTRDAASLSGVYLEIDIDPYDIL